MKKSFASTGHNKFRLTFPNGNSISIIWGVGSYTENLDLMFSKGISPIDFFSLHEKFLDSNTVEVMYDCDKKTEEKVIVKYGEGNPIGRLDIIQLLDILNILAGVDNST